jgi:integrase/recombinase XerD
MFENRRVAYLNAADEAAFLASLKSPKFYFLALLLDDCFMRVSEAAALKLKDFNFQKPAVYVRSLKKRGKNAVREVPLTRRVLDAATAYLASLKEIPAPDDYLFPAGNGKEEGHLSRKRIWAVFKKCGGIHPHMLRHTGATRLVENGASLLVVRDLLGHDGTRTTEIYTHTTEEKARLAVNAIERSTLFERVKAKLFPSKSVFVLPVTVGDKFHVGREKELRQLMELREKKVNTLLLADRGMGKSHILDNFQGDKLLRIDDFDGFKKTIANLCMHLGNGDKEMLTKMMNLNLEVVTKASPKRMIEDVLMKITDKHEYTIIIDDATRITPSVVPSLELLAKHFHMVVAARSIPIAHASWLSNFQKVEIGGLNREESRELIRLSCQDYKTKIEDIEMYMNHIYESSNGNPNAIIEMVQRFRVEKFVRVDDIQAIQHTAGRKRRSFVPILLIGIACLAISKFIIKEDSPEDTIAGQMIGGGIMIILMLSRFGLNSTKRKFV